MDQIKKSDKKTRLDQGYNKMSPLVQSYLSFNRVVEYNGISHVETGTNAKLELCAKNTLNQVNIVSFTNYYKMIKYINIASQK